MPTVSAKKRGIIYADILFKILEYPNYHHYVCEYLEDKYGTGYSKIAFPEWYKQAIHRKLRSKWFGWWDTRQWKDGNDHRVEALLCAIDLLPKNI